MLATTRGSIKLSIRKMTERRSACGGNEHGGAKLAHPRFERLPTTHSNSTVQKNGTEEQEGWGENYSEVRPKEAAGTSELEPLTSTASNPDPLPCLLLILPVAKTIPI